MKSPRLLGPFEASQQSHNRDRPPLQRVLFYLTHQIAGQIERHFHVAILLPATCDVKNGTAPSDPTGMELSVSKEGGGGKKNPPAALNSVISRQARNAT